MQKKRLFIALPVPHSAARSVKRIAEELEGKFKDFSEKQIRFVPQGNWHITVTFLGEQDDNTLPAIADVVHAASKKCAAPEIVFEKINYGPSLKAPRMIWLSVDRVSSERIAKIKDVLEDELAARGVRFQREMRLFSGHVTLARFGEEIESTSLPQIERPLAFSFSPAGLDLMESELKRPSFAKTSAGKSGAEYDVLQSFEFKE